MVEQLHIVFSGNQGKLTLFLQSGEGACQILKKNLSRHAMAKHIAENYPLSYEEPELKNNVCRECTKKCSRCRLYNELTNQELEKFIELVFHYQEGDSQLVEAIEEQRLNEY